jgi:biopolymer transport protein ExbB
VWRLSDAWRANQEFFETGGDVLILIFLATFVMWTLILERYWFLRSGCRTLIREVIEEWYARSDRTSWSAHQIRRMMVSRISRELNRTVPLIKTMVALCPLLGLLGTVTGMVEVFDVMAVAGSGNPRALASGVSRATIPTMAGMVAALSGFIFSVQLDRRARDEADRAADELALH